MSLDFSAISAAFKAENVNGTSGSSAGAPAKVDTNSASSIFEITDSSVKEPDDLKKIIEEFEDSYSEISKQDIQEAFDKIKNKINEEKAADIKFAVDEHDAYVGDKMDEWDAENPKPKFPATPEEIEAYNQKREAYLAEVEADFAEHNPEYVEYKETYEEMSKDYDEKMDEMEAKYEEENPAPPMSNLKAYMEWLDDKKNYMEGVKDSYLADNPDFAMYYEAFNQEDESKNKKLPDLSGIKIKPEPVPFKGPDPRIIDEPLHKQTNPESPFVWNERGPLYF